MLKKIMVILLAFVWLVALTLFLFVRYQDRITVVDGVVNTGKTPVGLRDQANEELPKKSRLLAGEFAPLRAQGKRWAHIDKRGQRYAVPKRHVSLGHVRVYKTFIFKKEHYANLLSFSQKYFLELYYASLIGFVVIALRLVMSIAIAVLNKLAKRGKKLPLTNFLMITQENLDSMVWRESHYEHDRLTREFQRKIEQVTIEQEKTLRQELTHELEISIRKQVALEFERTWIEEYRESLSKEINIEYHGKISEMESAARYMREEFEQKKKYAKILGVDLDDNEISNLVKGREFEIYCAKMFDAHPNILIKRWTPDKGIDNDIYVENNGDPDFFLETRNMDVTSYIAVECKFATPWSFRDQNSENFTWSKWDQYKRYGGFRKRENVEVLILTGVNAPASNPQQLYLAKLYDLKAMSEYHKNYKSNYISLQLAEPFKVLKSDLVDEIIECTLTLEHN